MENTDAEIYPADPGEFCGSSNLPELTPEERAYVHQNLAEFILNLLDHAHQLQ